MVPQVWNVFYVCADARSVGARHERKGCRAHASSSRAALGGYILAVPLENDEVATAPNSVSKSVTLHSTHVEGILSLEGVEAAATGVEACQQDGGEGTASVVQAKRRICDFCADAMLDVAWRPTRDSSRQGNRCREPERALVAAGLAGQNGTETHKVAVRSETTARVEFYAIDCPQKRVGPGN